MGNTSADRGGRLSGTERLENVSSLSSGITSFVVGLSHFPFFSRALGTHDFRTTTFSTAARNLRFDQWRYSELILIETSIPREYTHYFGFFLSFPFRCDTRQEDLKIDSFLFVAHIPPPHRREKRLPIVIDITAVCRLIFAAIVPRCATKHTSSKTRRIIAARYTHVVALSRCREPVVRTY